MLPADMLASTSGRDCKQQRPRIAPFQQWHSSNCSICSGCRSCNRDTFLMRFEKHLQTTKIGWNVYKVVFKNSWNSKSCFRKDQNTYHPFEGTAIEWSFKTTGSCDNSFTGRGWLCWMGRSKSKNMTHRGWRAILGSCMLQGLKDRIAIESISHRTLMSALHQNQKLKTDLCTHSMQMIIIAISCMYQYMCMYTYLYNACIHI